MSLVRSSIGSPLKESADLFRPEGRARAQGARLHEPMLRAHFEEAVLPHLDAAYNLARWLTGDDHDAEDVVQEAYLRAYKFFSGFRGGNARSWLLTVVRHTCYTWLKRHRGWHQSPLFDETHDEASDDLNPEKLYWQRADQELVRQALETLAAEFREVIVLRELEGLSYQEIAAVAGIPMGTVMSRLSRARRQLQQNLARRTDEEI
jgi:RNA polymerase sigma factor (sigma-70 family)